MSKTKKNPAHARVDASVDASVDTDLNTINLAEALAKSGTRNGTGQRIEGVRLSARRAAGKKSERLNYVLTIGRAHATAAGLEKGQQVEVKINVTRKTGELQSMTIERTDRPGLRLRGNVGQNVSLVFPMLNGLSLPVLKAGERVDLAVTSAGNGQVACEVRK